MVYLVKNGSGNIEIFSEKPLGIECVETELELEPGFMYGLTDDGAVYVYPVGGQSITPEKTKSDRILELENENALLKAQLQAQTDRSDFIEDCIAEMAMQVYAE